MTLKPPSTAPCILITGSSGRIGSAFIRRHGARFEEFAFDREGPPHPPFGTEHVVACDVSSDASVREALDTVRRHGITRIASVLHLAAYYDFSGKPSTRYEDITVRGTERLLHGLRDFEVEQFIFTSTMLVHGPTVPGRLIRETDPLEPSWDYPRSKVETEALMHRERGRIPVLSLRVAGVYDDGCHSIPIAHHIQRIYERQITSRFFPGEFSHGQSFLHMDDLVEAMYLAILQRSTLPRDAALLLGEPDVMSFEELQGEIARLVHGEEHWTTVRIPKILAKAGAWAQETFLPGEPFIRPWMIDHSDDHYELDLSEAASLLHWEPRRSLRETLPRMIDALKRDPERFYKENDLGEPPAR